MHAITSLLIDFIRAEAAARTLHSTATVDDWCTRSSRKIITDTMGGPMFASLGDFVAQAGG